MERNGWIHAQDIFHIVVDLPVEEQDPALMQHCGDNRELYELIASMLEEDRRQEGLLDKDLSDLARSFVYSEVGQSHFRGIEQIGSYRLVRPLGEGGMGIVGLWNSKLAIVFF